ncbi:MAG: hypothetical protein JW982_15530, partial [Spirochaetes bacterium]|nr:hypothetical protein [Spirochaetota bacterium]
MRTKIIIIMLMLITQMSCFNDLNDLIYEFSDFKEPICVIIGGGSAAGPGRGWAQAYDTLQNALSHASDGDEIWVAGDIDLSGSYTINTSVSIYGGFRGDEAKREDAGGRSKVTTSATPSQLFMFNSKKIIMDGFSFSNSSGGALQISENNEAIVSNSDFVNHTVSAVICQSYTKLNLFGCNFNGSLAGTDGGAIQCYSSVTLNISNSIFKNNTANNGGAIYCANSSKLNVINSSFQNNNAST